MEKQITSTNPLQPGLAIAASQPSRIALDSRSQGGGDRIKAAPNVLAFPNFEACSTNWRAEPAESGLLCPQEIVAIASGPA
jgi:hypothetical protein